MVARPSINMHENRKENSYIIYHRRLISYTVCRISYIVHRLSAISKAITVIAIVYMHIRYMYHRLQSIHIYYTTDGTGYVAQGIWHRVYGTGYILYHVRFTRLSISSALFFRLQDTFGGFSARFSCFSFVFSRFSRFIYYFLWLLSSSSSSSFGVFVVARALACVFSSGVRDLGQTEVRLEADAVASCAALRC